MRRSTSCRSSRARAALRVGQVSDPTRSTYGLPRDQAVESGNSAPMPPPRRTEEAIRSDGAVPDGSGLPYCGGISARRSSRPGSSLFCLAARFTGRTGRQQSCSDVKQGKVAGEAERLARACRYQTALNQNGPEVDAAFAYQGRETVQAGRAGQKPRHPRRSGTRTAAVGGDASSRG